MSTVPAYFHFAIPRTASKPSRAGALAHIAKNFDIAGEVQHVRSEPRFHLYRIKYERALDRASP